MADPKPGPAIGKENDLTHWPVGMAGLIPRRRYPAHAPDTVMLSESQAEVRRRWPHASPVQGDGPFAVIVSCWPNCGVWLYPTALEAKSHFYQINAKGCGHAHCTKKHRFTEIETVPHVAEELGYE